MPDSHNIPTALHPADCLSMIDVRKGVDAVDHALLVLLAQRFGYMDAAARIKETRGAVRDEDRKMQVLDNVRTQATALGLPVALLTQIWDDLVEGSIAYEIQRWDETHN